MRALGLAERVGGTELDLMRWVRGEVTGEALQRARRALVALCDATFLERTREE